MKKMLSLLLIFTLITSCTNPSMEDGLESLTASLAELEASLLLVDVDGMISDVATMQLQVEQMEVTVEEQNAAMEEAVAKMAEIKLRLEGILEDAQNWASAEQVATLRDRVAQVSEGIAMLVFVADYDYDGVMNGLDQCPDTPIEDINNVDGVGCAPDQTPITTDGD